MVKLYSCAFGSEFGKYFGFEFLTKAMLNILRGGEWHLTILSAETLARLTVLQLLLIPSSLY